MWPDSIDAVAVADSVSWILPVGILLLGYWHSSVSIVQLGGLVLIARAILYYTNM